MGAMHAIYVIYLCITVLSQNDTYCHFSAVGQCIVKLDAQGEVDFFCAEGAGLFDVELVSSLLDGDLQVVVLC